MSEEKLTSFLRIHITPSLFKWLKTEADYCGMSIAGYCRMLLDECRKGRM